MPNTCSNHLRQVPLYIALRLVFHYNIMIFMIKRSYAITVKHINFYGNRQQWTGFIDALGSLASYLLLPGLNCEWVRFFQGQ